MPEFQFQSTKTDYLAYQLYVASTSPRILRKRKKGKYLVTIVYVVLSILILINNVNFLGFAFLAFALMWFLFYPIYEAKKYIKHFETFYEENFDKKQGTDVRIELGEHEIKAFDYAGEGKRRIDSIEEIAETQHHVFVKLSPGMAYIIPKYRIENHLELNQWVKSTCQKYNIPHIVDMNWKWPKFIVN